MGLVRFNNKGYEYHEKFDKYDMNNKKYIFLFEADLTHNFLLDYVEKDISQLPALLEQYVTKKIDLETLNLSKYEYSDEDFSEIKELLTAIHPYYEHEFREVIINAIGNYLNSMIGHLVYAKQSLNEKVIEEKWYTPKFNAIAKPFLQAGDRYASNFYDKYRDVYCTDGYQIDESAEILIPDPKRRPRGFIQELRTQMVIKRMLHWILNISFDKLKKLSIYQRIWLYRSIYKYSTTDTMSVTQHLSFTPPTILGDDPYRIDETTHSQETYSSEIFSSLYNIRNYDVERDGIPSEMSNEFDRAIERAKGMSAYEINEPYEISNLHQLLYLEILSMVTNGTNIRRCKNCGMYFVVTNRKIAYCDRKINGEARCSAVGSKRSFQNKLDTEYPLKIYNRAYKTHYARYKNEKLTWDEFSTWLNEAKKNLQNVRDGKMTTMYFEGWLKI